MSKILHMQKFETKEKKGYDRTKKKRDIDKTRYITELEEIIIAQQRELKNLRNSNVDYSYINNRI